jgi:hypothetical protein
MFKKLKAWLDEPMISRKTHLCVYTKRIYNQVTVAMNHTDDNFEIKVIGVDAMRLIKGVQPIDESQTQIFEEGFVVAEKLSKQLEDRLRELGIHEAVIAQYDQMFNFEKTKG